MGVEMAINYGFSSKNAEASLLKLGIAKKGLQTIVKHGWSSQADADVGVDREEWRRFRHRVNCWRDEPAERGQARL